MIDEDNVQAVSKQAVNYRKGEGEQICAGCINFVEPESCKIVEGLIQPEGVCDLFIAQNEVDQMSIDSQLFGV